MEETVIIVNEADEVLGSEEKIRTHEIGALHRAFSIFVFNSRGQLLLQKRASTKYHSRSLWSNTCCGHPRPNESIEQAAHRRLKEEMGFDCPLKKIFSFIYRAELDTNLIEYEYDHVFVGVFDHHATPNKNEVDDWRWIDILTLEKDIEENSNQYTCWLKLSLKKTIEIFSASL